MPSLRCKSSFFPRKLYHRNVTRCALSKEISSVRIFRCIISSDDFSRCSIFIVNNFTMLFAAPSSILLLKKKGVKRRSIHSDDEPSHHLINLKNISYNRRIFCGGEIPGRAYHSDDLLARTTSCKSIEISREQRIRGIPVSSVEQRCFYKTLPFLTKFIS